MFNKWAKRKEKEIENEKCFTEGLKEVVTKSNIKQYPKWLRDDLHEKKHCLRKDRHSDINNYSSLYWKTENLFLCSNIPVTGHGLERHNEIHLLITRSLIFCFFSVKILLFRLPCNFYHYILTKTL